MSSYTERQSSIFGDMNDADSPEEKMLEIAKTFRPFSEGISDFLAENGYKGDLDDAATKAAYIRERFLAAGMQPPREVLLWFTDNQPVIRDTAFQLCFAFGLNLKQTESFFQHIFARERCFDCHTPAEAVYYWCMKNQKKWNTVQQIISELPVIHQGTIGTEIMYTGSIMRELDQLTSEGDLIAYMKENQAHFSYNNATASEAIQRLWNGIVSRGGLLSKEYARFSIEMKKAPGDKTVKVWDAYLAIMGINKEMAKELPGDRTLKTVADQLPKAVADSFPGRQSIDKVLRGQHVDYEVVRKMLIMLAFYDLWCRLAIKKGSYQAEVDSEKRVLDHINKHLIEAGYMELYVGNPYDWLYLYASQAEEPLPTFRALWQALTEKYLADASEKPNQ